VACATIRPNLKNNLDHDDNDLALVDSPD